jgi:hypothetical protein
MGRFGFIRPAMNDNLASYPGANAEGKAHNAKVLAWLKRLGQGGSAGRPNEDWYAQNMQGPGGGPNPFASSRQDASPPASTPTANPGAARYQAQQASEPDFYMDGGKLKRGERMSAMWKADPSAVRAALGEALKQNPSLQAGVDAWKSTSHHGHPTAQRNGSHGAGAPLSRATSRAVSAPISAPARASAGVSMRSSGIPVSAPPAAPMPSVRGATPQVTMGEFLYPGQNVQPPPLYSDPSKTYSRGNPQDAQYYQEGDYPSGSRYQAEGYGQSRRALPNNPDPMTPARGDAPWANGEARGDNSFPFQDTPVRQNARMVGGSMVNAANGLLGGELMQGAGPLLNRAGAWFNEGSPTAGAAVEWMNGLPGRAKDAWGSLARLARKAPKRVGVPPQGQPYPTNFPFAAVNDIRNFQNPSVARDIASEGFPRAYGR